MRIVIATDSFKGTLTSREAGQAISEGIRQSKPGAHVTVLPVADGGEGTVQALLSAQSGTVHAATVSDPLGRPVTAEYAVLAGGERTCLEMASASGITLLEPSEYDPLRATTYGTGQLLLAALGHSSDQILVGVGGSATVDGGCGAAQALGVRFLDAAGLELPQGIGGGQLNRIASIDISQRNVRLDESEIVVLCDVNNPLCGSSGAARVFGPQKGARGPDLDLLEANLESLARVIERDLGTALASHQRSGAAGGLAGGLLAFAGARLVSGIDTILEAIELDSHLAQADLVVTGEGRLDAQSMMGKVVGGVARRARALGSPVIAIAGTVAASAERCNDFVDAYYAVSETPDAACAPGVDAARALAARSAAIFAER